MKLKNHIILIGMPGCGKTSFGRDLAKELEIELYDTDECIVESKQKSIPDIFQTEGEEKFREYETEILKELLKKPISVISTGGGIIKSEENRDIMKNSGTVIFIDRPIEDIFSDVDTDTRPLLIDSKEKLYSLYKERYGLYTQTAKYSVLNKGDYYEVLDRIVALIKRG
jgi:shikimate kinase